MTKCPACEVSSVPGFHENPPSDAHPFGKVERCDVCHGTGLVTRIRLMMWELSL